MRSFEGQPMGRKESSFREFVWNQEPEEADMGFMEAKALSLFVVRKKNAQIYVERC